MTLYSVIGPLLRALDPETAHRLTLRALKAGMVAADRTPDDPVLALRLWDRDFANPLGLAAGFDKNAEVPDEMLGLGFGFVEIGSVTPRPQPGNPRPRLFRLPEDEAVINRMGFNNDGIEAAAERLELRKLRATGRGGYVGVNLGKNKDTEDAAADYVLGAVRLAPLADYLVINVSSPNTPGLRALQSRDALAELIDRVREALLAIANAPPLLLKIAPDLTEEDRRDIALVALAHDIDGLIVSNTTIARPENLKSRHRQETGGLSGRPLMGPSTALLKEMYGLLNGRIPLVGVGGIRNGADAYAKIRAGASLIQLYTALIYQGPALVGLIKRELAQRLRQDGFTTLSQAVGADCR